MNVFPPLNALVAFDTAARHSSFSKAAEELHVTPGAVGQLVRKLENWTGVALFNREIRRVTLTSAGKLYHSSISPALWQIVDASRALKEKQRQEVWISMPPGFAAKWFAPRMADFIERHPDISLNISASTARADFKSDRVDCAIRHFDGHDDSLDAQLLFADEARAFCSEQYRAKLQLQRPEDVRRATLLQNTLHPHWRQWCRRFAAMNNAMFDSVTSIGFDASVLAIEAATRHQGLVLSSKLLVADELSTRQLIEPFPKCALALEKGYYLVSAKHAAPRKPVTALHNWVLAQAGRMR
jgi:LysR family glycine cleavage system transcriptional activator